MFTKNDTKTFSKGGKTTAQRYGSAYMSMLGRKGGRKKKKRVEKEEPVDNSQDTKKGK